MKAQNFGQLVVQLHTFEIYRKSRIDFWSQYDFKQRAARIVLLERFSFECRKVIGFEITTLRYGFGLKDSRHFFNPIRSKTKTNRDALACFFPRFASATCNYLEF